VHARRQTREKAGVRALSSWRHARVHARVRARAHGGRTHKRCSPDGASARASPVTNRRDIVVGSRRHVRRMLATECSTLRSRSHGRSLSHQRVDVLDNFSMECSTVGARSRHAMLIMTAIGDPRSAEMLGILCTERMIEHFAGRAVSFSGDAGAACCASSTALRKVHSMPVARTCAGIRRATPPQVFSLHRTNRRPSDLWEQRRRANPSHLNGNALRTTNPERHRVHARRRIPR